MSRAERMALAVILADTSTFELASGDSHHWLRIVSWMGKFMFAVYLFCTAEGERQREDA